MNLFKCITPLLITLSILSSHAIFAAEEKQDVLSNASLSPQTRDCLGCHNSYTPGIVKDWLTSRHSKTMPGEAMKKAVLEKRISAEGLPKELREFAVGCFECHSQHPESHKDNFDHMGFKINVIVTPDDCRSCHPAEAKQFSESKKAYAYKDLMENSVYRTMVNTITGLKKIEKGVLLTEKPSESTLHETCL